MRKYKNQHKDTMKKRQKCERHLKSQFKDQEKNKH
jgi:hypothetical protein